MQLYYSLLLFIITFIGGGIPLWFKSLDEKRTHLLLAFSGSFLLSITLLHLLPETFEEIGHKAGLLLLCGFFFQLLIQRITHGVEHGHAHVQENTGDHHGHSHIIPIASMLLGLTLHAFMEGLPLGFHYRMQATEPSLYMAVAAHKLPEAMLITSLVLSVKGKKQAWLTLLLFSLVTPFAAILAEMLGTRYFMMANVVKWIIPIVAGAFIHIATTIFFESGTRQHMMNWQKVAAILLGVGLGLATMVME